MTERILTSRSPFDAPSIDNPDDPSGASAGAPLDDYFHRRLATVDDWLDRLLPPADAPPSIIHEAMRYSVFAGGKRLRPILVIASGEIFGAEDSDLLPAACALEMIHTYSLIHDDLPAMDNDVLRRGRPTCHVVYGEAMAILAGDALLTQAFHTLANCGPSDPGLRLRVLSEVAEAAGTTRALIGGQVLDILNEGRSENHQPENHHLDVETLEAIHRAKTGAMIRCAVRIGAILGRAGDRELELLTEYGEKSGLAFQIADDLLDETASSAELGKTAGKDAAVHKATYTSLFGLDGARARADALCRESIDALRQIPRETSTLAAISRFIVERKS
jgi:geranylgeranyl diphosphate synthase type II